MTKAHIPLALFTLLYTVAFGGYYISIQNFEFVWYIVVLVFFAALIAGTLGKTKFPLWLLWLLSLWGLMHMAGGGLIVSGDVLYRYELIHLFGSGDSFVLKFDQGVHFYGFLVATFAIWYLIKPYVSNPYAIPVLLTALFAGMGLGALNEVVEFLAVVFASQTGVGGYYNTALDLVFNTLGALVAVALLYSRRK